MVGRVLAVDDRGQTAIVELSPYVGGQDLPDGAVLYARDRDLRPVARLLATPSLRGGILGVRAVEGQPAVGDEVVRPVPEPPAAPPPAAPVPDTSRPNVNRR